MRDDDERDDELLRRFLLGELAEDEAESLELRLLQEDALSERGEAVEGDLFAASVRGELTPAENEQVARLAASPGGRARFALIRDLVHAAQEAPAELTPALLPFRPAAASPPRRAGYWLALAASLLLAVVGSWTVITHLPEMARFVNHLASSIWPSPAPPVPEPTPTTAVFQLGLSTLRSDGKLWQFAVPKGTGEIEIQLDLEGEEQFFPTFNAMVRNPGVGEVWSRQGLEPQTLDRVTALLLEIPAEKLPQGRYEMEVQGVSAEGQAAKIGVQEFEIVAD
jgi:phosphohistidine phosphatase SixA